MQRAAELWRFPVKSMQGEQVERLEVDERGVVGDRRLAVVDRATGYALSAKTVPQLLDAAAATGSSGVEIRLPDGTTVPGTRDADAALSEWLDRDVRLCAAGAGEQATYQMTFDPPNDDAELVEIPTPPGTYLDLGHLHLLTTASLASCAGAAPAVDWDRRRFRPNVLVDGAAEGYPEDAWVGSSVQIGDEVVVRVDMRTVRCALPLRAQPASGPDASLAREVGVYRALAAHHENHLGIYATVARIGAVGVGDAVVASATPPGRG